MSICLTSLYEIWSDIGMFDLHKKFIFFPYFLTFLVAFVLGATAMYFSAMVGNNNSDSSVVSNSGDSSAAFFDSEIANVQGTITNYTDTSITIKNTAGKDATYTLSPQLFIQKQLGNPNLKVATQSGQINQLEKDKPVTVSFIKTGGVFLVTGIIYTSL